MRYGVVLVVGGEDVVTGPVGAPDPLELVG